MKIEFTDECKTLRITPESLLDQVLLKKFDGAQVVVEHPKPFEMNHISLRIGPVEAK